MKRLAIILYSFIFTIPAFSAETFSISLSASVKRHQKSSVLSAGDNSLILAGTKEYPFKVSIYKNRGRSIASSNKEELTIDSTQSIDLLNKNARKVIIESP